MTKESRRPPAAGLYDEPITRGRDADLASLDASLIHHASLEEHEAPAALARLLHDRIESALKSVPKDNKVEEQLVLANRVLDALRTHAPKAKLTDEDDLAAPPRRLLAVLEPVALPATPTLAFVSRRGPTRVLPDEPASSATPIVLPKSPLQVRTEDDDGRRPVVRAAAP